MREKLVFWKEISSERKSLLGFCTAIILVLALILFAFVPMVQEALQAKEARSKLTEELVLYKKLAQNKDYPQILAKQKLELRSLENRLPKKLQQVSVMEEVYTFSKQSKVKILSLKEIKRDGLKKQAVAFQLKCSGDYQDIVKFLGLLENKGSFKNLTELILRGDELNGFLEMDTVLIAHVLKK